MMRSCAAEVPARTNPGVWLGTIFGTYAQRGRDKITIFTSKSVDSFGSWAEQLIAESTGKEGRGLVPVVGEPIGTPDDYGNDRVFVYLNLASDKNAALEKKIDALEKAGQPVVRLKMDDKYALGAEFFRWEFAIAVAGALIGIDAFDQPNVQESKDNTKRVLQSYEANKHFETTQPSWEGPNVAVTWSQQTEVAKSLRENIAAFLKQCRSGDYVALMAFVTQTDKSDAALEAARVAIRDSLKVATTLGYGPRFLHSTGQLHKGGANNILAIQITAEDSVDAPIPGEPYSFGVLKHAQAIGDWQSLISHGRRGLQIHLKRGAKIDEVAAAVQAAVEPEKTPKRAAPTKGKPSNSKALARAQRIANAKKKPARKPPARPGRRQ
jgi:hypothetical protein